MADANNPNGGNGTSGNGKNGGKVGMLEKVTVGVKEDIQALRTEIPTKASEGTDRWPEGSDQDPGLHLDLPPQAR